ncbi:hypothetical protein [Streptomyces sp. NPDC096095]|uniref:hypothetical protein n=1 Tax=Streptomyces sp. NPDC096095 TaxID=3155545 RepID=UPI00331C9DB8
MRTRPAAALGVQSTAPRHGGPLPSRGALRPTGWTYHLDGGINRHEILLRLVLAAALAANVVLGFAVEESGLRIALSIVVGVTVLAAAGRPVGAARPRASRSAR